MLKQQPQQPQQAAAYDREGWWAPSVGGGAADADGASDGGADADGVSDSSDPHVLAMRVSFLKARREGLQVELREFTRAFMGVRGRPPTDDELAAGLKMLREKIEKGEGAAWLAEREALRAEVGQTTTVIARKRA